VRPRFEPIDDERVALVEPSHAKEARGAFARRQTPSCSCSSRAAEQRSGAAGLPGHAGHLSSGAAILPPRSSVRR